MNLWVAILAAGRGERMGDRPKALLNYQNRTFLENIAETARKAGVSGVAVVIGYHGGQVETLAHHVCDLVVVNPQPEGGMSSSAQLLAKALPRDAAMLMWPVDMPAIDVRTIQALIRESLREPSQIIVPICGGSHSGGHPPLLPNHVVRDLIEFDTTTRLDHFLEGHPALFREIEVDDREIYRDIDHPEDLASLEQTKKGGSETNF